MGRETLKQVSRVACVGANPSKKRQKRADDALADDTLDVGLLPAEDIESSHLRSNPTLGDLWQPAGKPVRFKGPLYGPSGGPRLDDVHQGKVGDCYFACALSLVARFDPAGVLPVYA